MQVDSAIFSQGSWGSGDILSRIVETKRTEIAHLSSRSQELRDKVRDMPPPSDFARALREPATVSLIAEVKRRSPGAGPIRPNLDPVDLADSYLKAGASALSVLTDREYFGGSLEDLTSIRGAVSLPLLRKDFTLSEDQIREARVAGADAILLIVRILGDGPLADFRMLAEELGMAALVEVHEAVELERALDSGARVLGINNRNLRTFKTRLDTTLELLQQVPESVTLVSESGIRVRGDVERLGGGGIDAILVGEALLKASSPRVKAENLCGVRKAPRSVKSGTERGPS